MSTLLQAFELLAAICAALDTTPTLQCEGGRLFSPAFPGVRRPRKPWRIGVDPVSFSAVLQIESIDTAWMPLAGGSPADALTMICDTINAHIAIELDLPAGNGDRMTAPDAETLATLRRVMPDGPLEWSALAATLAAA